MPDQGFGGRIGTFFIVIGIFVILVFIASDFSKETAFPLFCTGAGLLGLGAFLRVRNTRAQETKPSSRFSLFRRGGGTGKSSEDKKQ
jgi:hypothetical protein